MDINKNKIKKVLLIYPPTGFFMRDDRCQAPVEGLTAQPPRSPLDLAYIAAVLKQSNFICKIKDYPAEKKEWINLEKDLKNFNPDVLLVSVTTATLDNDLKACVIAKKFKQDILTISKGAHNKEKDVDVLKKFIDLDIAIRGESEFTLKDILLSKELFSVLGVTFRENNEIVRTPDRPFLENLDYLPFPDRSLLNNHLYLTPDTKEPITIIYTGRGCPYRCIFCAVGIVSGYQLKLRTPESIVAEIEECVKKYDIKNFFFRADTFTLKKDWLIKICELILKNNLKIRWGTNSRVDTICPERLKWMKKAGCWVIGFGIESGNQDMLNKMKKNITLEQARYAVKLCKQFKIKTYLLFILGLPWEDKKSAFDTINFAKELDGDFVDFNVAYPLPGTELYDFAKINGLLQDDYLTNFNYSKPKIRSIHLSTEELEKLRKRAIREFYLRPSYITRTLISIKSVKVLKNYIKAGLRLVSSNFNPQAD